tara:strand:- start:16201 stop:16395 length:195 start_codon:yes stop_codon:yes gene_type:complete
MESLQAGQGKEVEPVSASGTPEDVQLVALSVIIIPQEQSAHDLTFFMVVCAIASFVSDSHESFE